MHNLFNCSQCKFCAMHATKRKFILKLQMCVHDRCCYICSRMRKCLRAAQSSLDESLHNAFVNHSLKMMKPNKKLKYGCFTFEFQCNYSWRFYEYNTHGMWRSKMETLQYINFIKRDLRHTVKKMSLISRSHLECLDYVRLIEDSRLALFVFF